MITHTRADNIIQRRWCIPPQRKMLITACNKGGRRGRNITRRMLPRRNATVPQLGDGAGYPAPHSSGAVPGCPVNVASPSSPPKRTPNSLPLPPVSPSVCACLSVHTQRPPSHLIPFPRLSHARPMRPRSGLHEQSTDPPAAHRCPISLSLLFSLPFSFFSVSVCHGARVCVLSSIDTPPRNASSCRLLLRRSSVLTTILPPHPPARRARARPLYPLFIVSCKEKNITHPSARKSKPTTIAE